MKILDVGANARRLVCGHAADQRTTRTRGLFFGLDHLDEKAPLDELVRSRQPRDPGPEHGDDWWVQGMFFRHPRLWPRTLFAEAHPLSIGHPLLRGAFRQLL